MAEPQRRRPQAGIRRTSEVVHVLDPKLILDSRTAKDWSQAELARRCNKSVHSISQVENGHLVRIKPSFARDLAQELELDATLAFSVVEPSTPSSSTSRGGR